MPGSSQAERRKLMGAEAHTETSEKKEKQNQIYERSRATIVL